MESKTIKIVGILALLAIIISVFAYTRGDGIGGDKYLNANYDLSFDVPKSYEVIEVTSPTNDRHSIVLNRKETLPAPENGEGSTAITIDIFSEPTSSDPDAWVRSEPFSNYGQRTTEITTYTGIDGVPALTYNWDGLYPGRSIVFAHEDRIYMVSGTYLEPSDRIYADFDEVVRSIELNVQVEEEDEE